MALDKKVFATRAKTALIYAVVMLTGLLWNEWSFFILFTIVHFGCWHEFNKLSVLIDPATRNNTVLDKFHFPIMGWGWMLMAASDQLIVGGFKINEAGSWLVQIGTYFIPLRFFIDKQLKWRQIVRSMGGIVYLSITLALLINLRSGWIWSHENSDSLFSLAIGQFSGKLICILLVVGIWINDTMAYVVGSFIGKTPLSSWSPKKTWEGTLGGIILSAGLISLVANLIWKANYEVFVISLVCAIGGTIGDLAESRLKRLAGVKDSGNFMPGHGGFLDRFDSILFAAPLVWVTCYLLNNYQ
jgi:phosphatidate cytidylyltransferase